MAAKRKPRRGRPPKHGESLEPFLVRLPASLRDDLENYKVKHDIASLNDVLVTALKEWLTRKKGKR
jgi:hypothetical protein